MQKIIVFIDGRNFIGKLSKVFEAEGIDKPGWSTYNFKGLLDQVLEGIQVDEYHFYLGRLKEHPSTLIKSRELIDEQRRLKLHLEQQGFLVELAGTVRGNLTKDSHGEEVLVFKEKGIDVALAVDMVSQACDGSLVTAIVASSDSDLQPAVRAVKARAVETIYLGFELQPNKGLAATTRRTILIRNAEVLQFKMPTLI